MGGTTPQAPRPAALAHNSQFGTNPQAPRAAARNPRLLVSLLLAMPFAIAAVLLLRNYLAFFGERYFIMMTPWLLLLAAAGAARIGEFANLRMGDFSLQTFAHSPIRPFVNSSPQTRL